MAKRRSASKRRKAPAAPPVVPVANQYREVYVARASAQAAKAAKALAPFTITVVFLGGLTTAQKNAFKAAANRWSKVIVGDLPNVVIAGQVIDDVLIEASGVAIDGAGGILGQAGPTHLRPERPARRRFCRPRGACSSTPRTSRRCRPTARSTT
jgi:hypothetical protein